jgi:hypothetical protein
MIIAQPKDRTLTKEHIEAILIALNFHYSQDSVHALEALQLHTELNKMPNLPGRFTLSEKSEIVFVAH